MTSRRQDSASDDSSDSNEDQLDLRGDADGWDDVDDDDDDEGVEVVSFYGREDGVFKDARSMIEHCNKKHSLDFMGAAHKYELDFYGAIKLANYLRAATKAGQQPAIPSSRAAFDDDKYLQPVLEDDALLFSLDEILQSSAEQTGEAEADVGGGVSLASTGELATSTAKAPSNSRLRELEDELSTLRAQFAEYRAAVAETLDKRWTEHAASDDEANASSSGSAIRHPARPAVDNDTHYFASYGHNEIHETMLRDGVRTGAYRDFLYGNKRALAGKTVLDVGCGTGILSLMAARAGAARVFAVDNSAVVLKAGAIVADNGLADVVTVVQANVEADPRSGAMHPLRPLVEQKADVLVSEWMGYCLLYEAMLDSVLRARDAFLAPGGLMAPSHMALRIAPVAKSAFAEDLATFWADVYGFDMRAMRPAPPHDVRLADLEPRDLVGAACSFLRLDLARAQVDDLSFVKPFECAIEADSDGIDAFAIWFDTFFFPEGSGANAKRWDTAEAHAERWPKVDAPGSDGSVAFTTGPGGEPTHWQTGVLTIDRFTQGGGAAKEPVSLKKGAKLKGTVEYRKRADNARELDIEVAWRIEAPGSREILEEGKQMWIMH